MKLISKFILFFLFSSAINAQQHWVKLGNFTQKNFTQVFFLDNFTGWIAGDSGLIFKTTNGGLTWVQQITNAQQKIWDIYFINKNLGWALSYEILNGDIFTLIIQSTNGGDNWNSYIYPEPNKLFLSLFFIDSLNGWMCGGDIGTVVSTQDGGLNWSEVRVLEPEYPRLTVHKIKFYGTSIGIAVGGVRDLAAVVWRTTNGGESWSVSLQGTEPLYDIHFIDEQNIIAFGGDFEFGASVVRTSNAGEDWDYQFIGVWGEGRGVSFRTPENGFVALGYSGTYMYTTDFGNTWIDVQTPDSTLSYDVSFPDSQSGFMVGSKGSIFKYAKGRKLQVSKGWNLVSNPYFTDLKLKNDFFANASSNAYRYIPDQGYQKQDTIFNGYGYWIKFPENEVINFYGAERLIDSIYVKKGWNIIGSISQPVSVNSIRTYPDGLIGSNFFYFENGYRTTDTIRPTLGYWVKVKDDGYIILK